MIIHDVLIFRQLHEPPIAAQHHFGINTDDLQCSKDSLNVRYHFYRYTFTWAALDGNNFGQENEDPMVKSFTASFSVLSDCNTPAVKCFRGVDKPATELHIQEKVFAEQLKALLLSAVPLSSDKCRNNSSLEVKTPIS